MQDFTSAQEMDETMILRWNTAVRPQDKVYHLGDVTMDPARYLRLISRLNGHKRLILGNHDSGTVQEYLAAGFQKIYGCRVLDQILFTHIPVHPSALGRFKANVHGHVHEKPSPEPVVRVKNDDPGRTSLVPYINVSVEVTEYRPITFEEVRQRIRTASECATSHEKT